MSKRFLILLSAVLVFYCHGFAETQNPAKAHEERILKARASAFEQRSIAGRSSQHVLITASQVYAFARVSVDLWKLDKCPGLLLEVLPCLDGFIGNDRTLLGWSGHERFLLETKPGRGSLPLRPGAATSFVPLVGRTKQAALSVRAWPPL
jgi:hypothetical protein